MSLDHSATRTLNSYPVSLQHTAEALWGGNFWGRERINPEPPSRPQANRANARSRSSA